MIFLPNKFERMISALRNTVQNLILKNGMKTDYLYMMMLILKAEALNSNETEPIDLREFTNKILSKVYIKKKGNDSPFSFLVGDIGKCIINIRLYTSLIFLLCRQSDKIIIQKINDKIFIKSCIKNHLQITKEIRKLNGFYLKEIITDCVCVILTPCETDKTSVENKKDWFDITNPLSMINCYLN